jgi:hypothetical protein
MICNSIYSKNREIHCIYTHILNNVSKSENINKTYPKTLNQSLSFNKEQNAPAFVKFILNVTILEEKE